MVIRPSWAVTLTACEPRALVETQVRWHLATGASAVFLYLDDPADAVAGPMSQISGCHVTLCDDAHWHSLRGQKGRPASQMRRQTLNANHALKRCQATWLFHIDADEFIWQDAPLADALETVPEGHEVNLRPYERLFPPGPQQTLFDGAFRCSADLDADAAAAAYGPDARFMKRGQFSHGAGKSGVRPKDGLRLGVHNATRRAGDRWRRAPQVASVAARLLHFDGVTPLHWILKFLRYRLTSPDVQAQILQPHRAAQIEWALRRINTRASALDAHADLFTLTADRTRRLRAHDLLAEIAFDPRAVLGAACPNLDPAAFDADLLARSPWARDLLD